MQLYNNCCPLFHHMCGQISGKDHHCHSMDILYYFAATARGRTSFVISFQSSFSHSSGVCMTMEVLHRGQCSKTGKEDCYCGCRDGPGVLLTSNSRACQRLTSATFNSGIEKIGRCQCNQG